VVKPSTGSPVMADKGASNAMYQGTSYALKTTYTAETTYVQGEFYWPVQRGQKTSNRDFASGKKLLSMEQTRSEVVWSVGEQMDSVAVAQAFKLEGKKDLFKRGDALPVSHISGMGCGTIIVVVIVVLVLISLLGRCSSCDPDVENCSSSSSSSSTSGSYRSSGGSYGGYSGGGGHK
jgi:uncharacterized membrane protein YgcG